ncbi:MAG: adenylate kinase family protein [Thermoproteus sp.]
MRVLITGTPGVGKTTVCRIAAQRLGVRCVEAAAVLAGKPFTSWDPYSLTYDIIDVDAARRELSRELAGDYILDTHVLDLVGDVDRVFVLRKRPDVLLRDLSGRDWPLHKILDNVWAELLDYIYVEARDRWGRVHQIDVTDRSSLETADAVVDCLKGGVCIDERVDWLSYSLESGFLERLESISNRTSSRRSSSPPRT